MRLSRLQRVILLLAYENEFATPADVKRDYYHFHYLPGRAIHFKRGSMDIAHHNAASVAIAKAFNRLTERGLTERRYNHGVKLTPEGGREAANYETVRARVVTSDKSSG